MVCGHSSRKPEWFRDIWTLNENCSGSKDNLTQKENHRKESCLQNTVSGVYSSYVPFIIDAVYSVAHGLATLTKNTNLTVEVQKRLYLEKEDMQKLLSIIQDHVEIGHLTKEWC